MLIVEDNPAARFAMKFLLAREGFEVDEAATVAEGLAKLNPPPNCIVLDLMLPDGSGEEVLQRVREDRLPTCVAVCTAVGDPERLEAVKAMGAHAVLEKPIKVEDVVAACDAMPRDGNGDERCGSGPVVENGAEGSLGRPGRGG